MNISRRPLQKEKKLSDKIKSIVTIPVRGKAVSFAFPPFGPMFDFEEFDQSKKMYSHPIDGTKLFLRKPRTFESLALIDFALSNREKVKELEKLRSFECPLMIGQAYCSKSGIFIDPPFGLSEDEGMEDEDSECNDRGEPNRDRYDKKLKELLKQDSHSMKGFVMIRGGMAYSEDEVSYRALGVERFCESPLAKALERTKKTAKLIKHIFDKLSEDIVYIELYRPYDYFVRPVYLYNNYFYAFSSSYVGNYFYPVVEEEKKPLQA